MFSVASILILFLPTIPIAFPKNLYSPALPVLIQDVLFYHNDRHSQCNGRTLATCAPGENDSLAPLPHKGSRRGARRGQTAKMFSLRTPVQPYPRLPRSLSFSPPQAPLPSYRSICLKGPRKGGSPTLHFISLCPSSPACGMGVGWGEGTGKSLLRGVLEQQGVPEIWSRDQSPRSMSCRALFRTRYRSYSSPIGSLSSRVFTSLPCFSLNSAMNAKSFLFSAFFSDRSSAILSGDRLEMSMLAALGPLLPCPCAGGGG